SSTASQCACANVPTTTQFMAWCAFGKNQILTWRSRLFAGETFGGTPECSYGPCLRCFANLIVMHRSWLIFFHNCARREISTQLSGSVSANCRASRLITPSWRKLTAFWSDRLSLIGTISEAGVQWRITLKKTHAEMLPTLQSQQSI